jgi:hypothetical protein
MSQYIHIPGAVELPRLGLRPPALRDSIIRPLSYQQSPVRYPVSVKLSSCHILPYFHGPVLMPVPFKRAVENVSHKSCAWTLQRNQTPYQVIVFVAICRNVDTSMPVGQRCLPLLLKSASLLVMAKQLHRPVSHLLAARLGSAFKQTTQPYKPVQNSGSIAGQWILFYASGYQF